MPETVDYIVDQYISQDKETWSWRKWNSGLAECWVEDITKTNTHYDTWLGGYTHYLDYDLPITFVNSDYCVVFSGWIGAGYACSARHIVIDSSTVRLYYLASDGSSNVAVHSSIMVKGRWK